MGYEPATEINWNWNLIEIETMAWNRVNFEGHEIES